MIALDTHIVIWLGEDSSRISSTARHVIDEAGTTGQSMVVSAISLFEIVWGILRGRIQSSLPVDELLVRIERQFTIRSVSPAIAQTAAQLPSTFPSDPFDRIIAATAIVEGLPLVTADRNIRRSRALRTLW
jgi:PIN domain nuclease of toxin-antitoxin system